MSYITYPHYNLEELLEDTGAATLVEMLDELLLVMVQHYSSQGLVGEEFSVRYYNLWQLRNALGMWEPKPLS